MLRSNLTNTLDSLLEGSVIGSFTNVGFAARERLHDWEPVDADLAGSTAIVTGATSGIGKATAAGLLELGCDVYVTSRSQERADDAASELSKRPTSAGEAFGMTLDTGDFDSIMDFVRDIQLRSDAIDILIHNAGALTDEYQTDEHGRELTLSTHLIGPYLLTTQLRPHLGHGARVLFMSSGGMYTQGLDVDQIEMTESEYRGAVAYARAKRGQVELVHYLGSSWSPDVQLHAVHPGWVETAGVDAGLPGFGKVMGPLLRSAEQGADTMVWLAAVGARDSAAGQFWFDRKPRRTAYLPGTGTDDRERKRLIEWLDLMILPATVTG